MYSPPMSVVATGNDRVRLLPELPRVMAAEDAWECLVSSSTLAQVSPTTRAIKRTHHTKSCSVADCEWRYTDWIFTFNVSAEK